MKRHLTLERAVEVAMTLFALASIGNVAEFLGGEHNALTAYGLAIALGSVLVLLSIMLARTDHERERQTFVVMLVAVLAVVALSGVVQTLAYQTHYPTWKAALFGFGLPLVGEALLAFACAVYVAAEKRRKIRQAADHTRARVAESVADALAVVDVSRSRAYVERQVDKIVRSQIDSVVREMLPDIDNASAPDLPALPKPDSVSDGEAGSLDRANQTRQRAKLDAMNAMLSIYEANPHASLREVGQQIDRSPETVRGYLSELEQQNRIHRNGDGVEILAG
jgi:uncharacterized membrane protein